MVGSSTLLARVGQRLTPGKAVLDTMPMDDILFSVTPAEEYGFLSQKTGKMHKSFFHPFTDTAQTVDFLNQLLNLLHGMSNGFIHLELLEQIRTVGGKTLTTDDRLTPAPQKLKDLKDPSHE